MLLFPEKQRLAQAELDRVVGSDRLPEFSDRQSLPYVEALMLEVFRTYPVFRIGTFSPFPHGNDVSHPNHIPGLPRRVMSDDVYQGMRIPKGATIIPNAWYAAPLRPEILLTANRGMLHDEEEYPDPLEFRPERFLPEEGKKIPMDPSKIAFGFGRR